MIVETIATEIMKKATSIAVGILGDRVKKANESLATKTISGTYKANLTFDLSSLHHGIRDHLVEIQRWANLAGSKQIPAFGKSVADIYVELEIFVTPIRQQDTPDEKQQTIAVSSVINHSSLNIAFIGQPGAGKTTLVKKICLDFFNRGKILGDLDFPLLIRLRDIQAKDSQYPIFTEICSILPIALTETERARRYIDESSRAALIRKNYIRLLDKLGCTIILEGFDELGSRDLKDRVVSEVRSFCSIMVKSRVLITSRTGEFEVGIDFLQVYEIAPLDERQIRPFALKWLEDAKAAEAFLSTIKTKPFYGTSVKPLLLAHLCAIYKRKGRIPDKPKDVYSIIVNLLLEEWDEQNSVKRPSRYSSFSFSEKHEFLSQLSFELTTELGIYEFRKIHLERAYRGIYRRFGLPESEARLVANELESNTGLFCQSGRHTFEFFHRSIQEFLAAEYIVKLPTIESIHRHLPKLPSQLAVATALSSNPSSYFSYVILSQHKNLENLPSDFFDIYATRLSQELPNFEEDPLAVVALYVLASACSADLALDRIANALSAFNRLRFITQYYSARRDMRDTDAGKLSKQILTLKREHDIFSLPETIETSSPMLKVY